jgi:hypothetical protein
MNAASFHYFLDRYYWTASDQLERSRNRGVVGDRSGHVIKLLVPILLLVSSQVWAQGTGQSAQTGSRPSATLRTGGIAVPTQPSSDPFRNPLMQGVPPAASSNRFRDNRTSVPLNPR